MKKSKHWILVTIALLLLGGTTIWWRTPRDISGREFVDRINASAVHSDAEWTLYSLTDDYFYVRFTSVSIPRYFKVRRDQVSIRNAANGGSAVGVIYLDQVSLLAEQ